MKILLDNIKNMFYKAFRCWLEKCSGSSVGRAEDWKSSCRRFDPVPEHHFNSSLSGAFFYALTNKTSLFKLVFLGTGPLGNVGMSSIRLKPLSWHTNIFQDFADTNNQSFGCWCLAIPSRTISIAPFRELFYTEYLYFLLNNLW